MVLLARAAELLLPWRFYERNLGRMAVVEQLSRFGSRVLSQDLIDGCAGEIDKYKAEANGVDATTDLSAFWLSRAKQPLPHWAKAFIIIGLIQPSSASAERGFSVFERVFGRNELPGATQELMETTLKARMNKD